MFGQNYTIIGEYSVPVLKQAVVMLIPFAAGFNIGTLNSLMWYNITDTYGSGTLTLKLSIPCTYEFNLYYLDKLVH